LALIRHWIIAQVKKEKQQIKELNELGRMTSIDLHHHSPATTWNHQQPGGAAGPRPPPGSPCSPELERTCPP